MSYQATNWAWEQDLPMAQKFVLVALADMADEAHSCFPGQKRIAGMVGSSERTVRRALGELEEAGLISREERRATDGYRTSDRYVLNLTGQIVRQSSHRPSATVSPDNLSDLTGHSDRAEEPSVNHQKNHQVEVAQKRGSRIPDPFVVTAAMRDWAGEEVAGVNVDRSTRMFVDYWRAESGAKASKRDWVAAWRNWLRKDFERVSGHGRPAPVEKAAGIVELGQRMQAAADRKAVSA